MNYVIKGLAQSEMSVRAERPTKYAKGGQQGKMLV